MRKFTRVSLIVVAVMAGTGILLLGVSSVMGAGYSAIKGMAQSGTFNFGPWHFEDGIYWNEQEQETDRGTSADEDGAYGSEKEQETYAESGNKEIYRYQADGVKELDVEIGAAEVVFQEGSEASEILVTVVNGSRKYYEGELDGDALVLAYHPKEIHAGKGKTPKIIVEIPGGTRFEKVELDVGASTLNFEIGSVTCKEMSLTVGAGTVTVGDLTVEEKLDVEIGVGTAELYGISCGTLDAECGMGEFIMDGAVSGDIDAECSMGSMVLELDGNESDYNYDLSCGMGDLTINESSFGGIGGSRQIRNQNAVGTIRLDCGMGTLDLQIN